MAKNKGMVIITIILGIVAAAIGAGAAFVVTFSNNGEDARAQRDGLREWHEDIERDELPQTPEPEPAEPQEQEQAGPHQMEITTDILQRYFDEAGLTDTVSIEFDGEGQILIITNSDMYFDTGQAVIRPETFPILDVIASAINNLSGIRVSVEGHTDNVPIATARFPDNLELSVAKAASILRYFIDYQGVDPSIIRATGFGEHHPIADNAMSEGRQANRRVEIRIYEAD